MDIWFLLGIISVAISSIGLFIGGFMTFFMDDTASEWKKTRKKFGPTIIALFAVFGIFLSVGFFFMEISSRYHIQ